MIICGKTVDRTILLKVLTLCSKRAKWVWVGENFSFRGVRELEMNYRWKDKTTSS